MSSKDSRPLRRLTVAALVALCAAAALSGPGAGLARAAGPVWRNVNPDVVDSYYYGVACAGARAWVVGNDETILYTADSGQHWALHHVGPASAYALYRVGFIDVNRGWAVGNGGVILYTPTGEAGGWSRQESPRNGILNDLSMLSPAGTVTAIHGWIAGSSGTVLHTESADQPTGVVWSEIDTGVTSSTDYNGVDFASHQIGWVVGDLYDSVTRDWSIVIKYTDNGGATWSSQGPVPATKGSLNAVDAVGAEHAWTVGERWDAAALRYRAIGYRTVDGGHNWYPMDLGDRRSLADVRFIDSHNGWIAGEEVLLHTTDGGITWTEEAIPGFPALNGLDVTAAGEGFAVGYVNTVLTRGIDGTPPLTGDDADEQWSDGPVTVDLAATDDAAGVAAISYRVNGGALSTVPGAQTAVPFFAPPDHAGDGDHVLTYWAVDKAGNSEAVKSCRVKIDTRDPRSSTPGRYTVRRYRYVKLKYRIVDAQPQVYAPRGSVNTSPSVRAWKTASATLRVRNGAGKVVKTVQLGPRTTGTWYTCRLRATWKPGRYRYQVRASDPAQNRSPWSTPGVVTCVRG